MQQLVYEAVGADGVVCRTYYDDVTHSVTVEHFQDLQGALDEVAAMNAAGPPTIDGLGKPIMNVPVVLAKIWCLNRGIDYEKMMYSNDYDDEFRRFGREYSRLCYESRKTVHTVQ